MKVTVLSKQDFDQIMRCSNVKEDNVETYKNSCFISIIDPFELEYGNHQSYFLQEHKNVKIMRFGDYTESIDGLGVFTDEQAKELYDFIKFHENTRNVFIHCSAGISRSGAVGTFINEYFSDEPYESFKRRNYKIFPNSLVLSKLRQEHFKRTN